MTSNYEIKTINFHINAIISRNKTYEIKSMNFHVNIPILVYSLQHNVLYWRSALKLQIIDKKFILGWIYVLSSL